MVNNKKELITFQWFGINCAGEKAEGIIEANSMVLAKAYLRQQGIIIKKIVKKRKSLFNNSKKITPGDITLFSRQLSTMIEAGIPIVQSFDIIAKGQKNECMRMLIERIKKDIEAGLTLAEALHKHPVFFNDLFCNLIDSGERSGSLDIMLDKVATYKEKIETIKKKIKKTLTYPVAVLVIAFLITVGLLVFVVPQFESLFEGFGADLPFLTRFVVNLSRFFKQYWYVSFAIVCSAIYSYNYAIKHSLSFAHRIDRMLLKLPICGVILEKAAIARFSRTFAITFAAGLPLVEALKAVSGVTGNVVYAEATEKIRQDISNGQQMQLALKKVNLFPNMVVQMIAIGEESGKLEHMLSKVADFYEEEVDNAVDSLSSLLEPAIMSILGMLVGGLVVAMYLPIFKLGSVM